METIDELTAQDIERIYKLIKLSKPVPEVLVSCTEAARLLNKSPNTITRMLREGRLHRATIGTSCGIRLSEILG